MATFIATEISRMMVLHEIDDSHVVIDCAKANERNVMLLLELLKLIPKLKAEGKNIKLQHVSKSLKTLIDRVGFTEFITIESVMPIES